MRIESACSPRFARHETFHPRFGWFRKAFVATAFDPDIFTVEDATVRLGVGKNMVRSLRFWGTAAHLIVDDPSGGRRNRASTPTNLAAALLGSGGIDPYMERSDTWWWLHWLLVGPHCHLPVWWIIFHKLDVVEFDDDMMRRACEQVIDTTSLPAPKGSSIAKDISVFVRTYGNLAARRTKFDDRFGCPLRDLNLLTRSPTGRYRLAVEGSNRPPAAILLIALLDYAVTVDHDSRRQDRGQGDGANTIMIDRAATDPGGPGRAFRVAAGDIDTIIGPIVEQIDGLTVTSPAGSAQLGWSRPPVDIARSIIDHTYGHHDLDDIPPVVGPEARSAYPDRELLRLHIFDTDRHILTS